jgi:carboxyl-terminal processing protease
MRLPRLVIGALGLFAAACADPTLSPRRPMTNVEVFDAVWKEMNLSYSMFALKGVNWDSVGSALRPRAEAASTEAEVASVVGQMLMSVHDRHVTLTAGNARYAYYTARDSQPAPIDESLIARNYLAGQFRPSGAHVKFGRLSPTVGYVRIASFNGSDWADEVDNAIDSLAGVHALAVDVRSNGGGNYNLAVDIAGRFADHERLFGFTRLKNGPGPNDFTSMAGETVRPTGRKQFTGPVYVLTNRKIYSSGEDFVLAMRALPTVTVVGDTTGGSTGKPIVRELSNGWTFQLSSWIEYTPERTPFEDVGLAPDLYVASDMRSIILGVDPVLKAVLDRQ